MVDPVAFRPGFAVERKSTLKDAVEAVAKTAQPLKTGTDAPQAAETSVRTIARELSSRPPVDHERVQQIKRAIAEGRFPIVPARIADRLIAAGMSWARTEDGAE